MTPEQLEQYLNEPTTAEEQENSFFLLNKFQTDPFSLTAQEFANLIKVDDMIDIASNELLDQLYLKHFGLKPNY